tara:strand:+ start:159 stop:548 length:390 start_codon:yes stop_codon:yes gene_type:complete
MDEPAAQVTLTVTSATYDWVEYEIHNGTDEAIEFATQWEHPIVIREVLHGDEWKVDPWIGCGNGMDHVTLQSGQCFASGLARWKRARPTRLKLWVQKPAASDEDRRTTVALRERWGIVSDLLPAYFARP